MKRLFGTAFCERRKTKNRFKSNNYLRTRFANIKKFNQRIKTLLTLRPMAKNILVGICSFIITSFVYVLLQTRSPLRDVVTTDRISILKDRPPNITRDIIVDMSSFWEVGGIMTLTLALVEDIAKKRPNWRLLVLISKDNRHIYNLPNLQNIKPIEVNVSFGPTVLLEKINPESFDLLHDKIAQLLYYDLFFCDKNCDLIWDVAGDSNICNFVTVPRISTIHDLASFDTTPEFFRSESCRLGAKVSIENAIHFSKRIITVSKFSQERICDKFQVTKDFVKYIPIQLGRRVYSQVNPEAAEKVLCKYNLKAQKYFIFCSSWWKNKNHGALMKAFNKFAEKNAEIKLMLVGKHPAIFASRPITEFATDRLIISGFVSDEELSILLKNALAFIHPSVYEGFGMPIIEAMANGIPVACSNVTSLPEVAGPAGLQFDPYDIDSITQAMHRLANDKQLRNDLVQKGYLQAKKYSDRDAMVDEYIRLIEQVMLENDLIKARKALN